MLGLAGGGKAEPLLVSCIYATNTASLAVCNIVLPQRYLVAKMQVGAFLQLPFVRDSAGNPLERTLEKAT